MTFKLSKTAIRHITKTYNSIEDKRATAEGIREGLSIDFELGSLGDLIGAECTDACRDTLKPIMENVYRERRANDGYTEKDKDGNYVKPSSEIRQHIERDATLCAAGSARVQEADTVAVAVVAKAKTGNRRNVRQQAIRFAFSHSGELPNVDTFATKLKAVASADKAKDAPEVARTLATLRKLALGENIKGEKIKNADPVPAFEPAFNAFNKACADLGYDFNPDAKRAAAAALTKYIKGQTAKPPPVDASKPSEGVSDDDSVEAILGRFNLSPEKAQLVAALIADKPAPKPRRASNRKKTIRK